MKSILLHACCGPCSTHCVCALRQAGLEPVLYYANSNIDTVEEWRKRLDALEKFALAERVDLLVEPWNGQEWEREVAAGFECEKEGGARCDRCFLFNLGKAARKAAMLGFDAFTTTLTVSPHKSSARVFAAGAAAVERENSALASGEGKVLFRQIDFKKKGGFLHSVALARQFGLYRQDYCGCRFSKAAAVARKEARL